MATLKQIQANRLNALKSTGPKTLEGKAAVALNSLRHGLRARAVVLPGEDRQEFQLLCDQLEAEWQPRTRTEQAYVEQLAISLWKLGRADAAEASVLLQRAAAGNQIPLLQYLWQAQFRLERAFARAHVSLEHIQNARPQASGSSGVERITPPAAESSPYPCPPTDGARRDRPASVLSPPRDNPPASPSTPPNPSW
jgi:hypothetical protein